MMNIKSPLALLALTALVAIATDVSAQNSRTMTLAITVVPRKPGGAAWDAFGGAPDIAICTNSAFGQRCFAAGTGVYASPAQFGRGRCQDSFGCIFAVVVPATGPFSLTVYDVDISAHDTIGSCMIDSPAVYACGSARVGAI